MSNIKAIYYRSGVQYTEDCSSVKEAAQFLLDGENNGSLSSVSIQDGDTLVFDNGSLQNLRDLGGEDD